MNAYILKTGLLGMQLCVPKNWSEAEIIQFAEEKNPCGTTHGWFIAQEGDTILNGDPSRVQCPEKKGFVHMVVVA